MPRWWQHNKGRFEKPFRLEIITGQPSAVLSARGAANSTTVVDLVHGSSGFYLADWRPSATFYKDGGTYQESPLSNGRRLVDKKFTNGIERFSLKLTASTQDGSILDMRGLRQLLEFASDYWTSNGQGSPVYLLAQGRQETSIRYAIIYAGTIPEDENPYGQPFVEEDGRSLWDGITLIIERGAWSENPPGEGTAVEIGASEAYDGRTLGNVTSAGVDDFTTTAGEVFVTNKRVTANLSDVYNYNNGLTSWSTNIMDGGTIWSPPANTVNDAVYFGIDTALANSGPFSSIVLDILQGAAAATSYTILWEYYNGAAWVTFTTIQDNTSQLSLTGVRSVNWAVPSAWATVNLFTLLGGTAPSITGYWVRARLSALTGLFTAPTIQNRRPYSVIWPYIEFVSTQIGGDTSALARLLAANQSTNSTISQVLGQAYSDRVVIGSRSTDRGANFTAYLNAADEQNPSGVTVSIAAVANVNTTLVTYVPAPTGRSYLVNAAAAQSLLERVVINLDQTIASHFYGVFHVYGRFEVTTATSFTAALKVSTLGGQTVVQTPTITVNSLSLGGDTPGIADFGTLSIPPTNIVNDTDTTDELEFTIMVSVPGAADDIYIYDLILIPVDEWAGDFIAPNLGSTGSASVNRGDTHLDADSITLPKTDMRSILRFDSNDSITSRWQAVATQFQLKRGREQRLWFLSFQNLGTTGMHQTLHSIQLYRAQQYLSMRGNS